MAIPVTTDYFGAGSQVVTADTQVTATVNAPALIIPFAALSAAGLNVAASMSDPDKVLAAIIKYAYTFTKADTAEESGIEVSDPRRSFVTRGNQTRIAFDYSVTVYLPDTTPTIPDPDDVV